MLRAGSSYLSSHAILENPRLNPDDPCVVYWDAIIRCSNDDVPLICSLRYVKDCSENVAEGTYFIFANVIPQKFLMFEQCSECVV